MISFSPRRSLRPPLHRGRRKSSPRSRTGTSTSSSRSPELDHDRKAEFRERHCLFRRGAFLAAREASAFRSCAPITGSRQHGFHGGMRSPQTPPAGSAFLRRETDPSVPHYGNAGSDVTSVATKKPCRRGRAFCSGRFVFREAEKRNPAKARATGGVREPWEGQQREHGPRAL